MAEIIQDIEKIKTFEAWVSGKFDPRDLKRIEDLPGYLLYDFLKAKRTWRKAGVPQLLTITLSVQGAFEWASGRPPR